MQWIILWISHHYSLFIAPKLAISSVVFGGANFMKVKESLQS